jgi:pilus assembly protein CpaC
MKFPSAPVDGKLAALACAVLVAVAGVSSHAQVPVRNIQPGAPQPAAATPAPRAIEYPKVNLTAGRSTVLTTDFDISRIAITNPAIADATVVQPREILIDGKAPGTISLIVWGPSTHTQYDLVVEQPVTPLQQNLQMLFPGEDIQVSTSDDSTILSGQVSSTNIMLRAGEIAQASASKRKVINLLQVPGGNESQQVLLQVRFAEVNRRVLQEVGVSFFAQRQNFTARSSTQQFAAPELGEGGELVFSDLLNLFFFDQKRGIGGMLKALESRGAFQSLAEPNLIAYNGQEASFLAGGEFPVPVVQGTTGTVSVTFKEFGIRLTFTPTIAGDAIRLKVKPEVSTLDFANGVSLGGFRIPALTTRRAETDVELRDGQSFAIAGLLDNLTQEDRSGIPILSKLPIIGALFKSKGERAEQTELMVLITPRLVRALDPDEVPPLPTRFKPFLGGPPGPGGGGDEFQGTGSVDAPAPRPADSGQGNAKPAAKKPGGR